MRDSALMVSAVSASRGHRLHRDEQTEAGATQASTGKTQRFFAKHLQIERGSSEVRYINVTGDGRMTPVHGIGTR
jgi:hypothetical protein